MNDKSSLSGLSHIAKLKAENEGLKAKLARLHELTDCPPDRTLDDWAKVLEAVWRKHYDDHDGEKERLKAENGRLQLRIDGARAILRWGIGDPQKTVIAAYRELDAAPAGPDKERGDE